MYQSKLFCCECSTFGDVGCRGFCLFSNIITAHSPPKIQHQCLCPEIMIISYVIIHRPCCETFHVGTTFLLARTTFLIEWKCSQHGLWIILSNEVMISETLLLSFSNVFLFLWLTHLEHHLDHYTWEKAEISTANISKNRQLLPKLSRQINNTTRKMIFLGEILLLTFA